MHKIKVAIVDDQKLFRQSLAMLVSAIPGFDLIAEAENGDTFWEQLNSSQLPTPDVALVDIDMPGMNGIELNRLIHAQYPLIKVIILSVHLEEQLITQVINDGASSYLAKNCDKEELVKAITAVHTEGFYINQLSLQALTRSAQSKNKPKGSKLLPVDLTKREIQVLDLICREHNNAEIAEKLYISARTVEGHRINLLAKTGCRNTAGLVLFAVKHRLFEAPL